MMNRQPLRKQLGLVLALLCLCWNPGISQGVRITLEEALLLARSHYAGLQRDRLSVEQQQKMAESGILTPPAQLFLSGEEFNFHDQSGVQSINIQQNFYLPKAVRTQKSYYQQGAYLAEKRLALTGQELKRQLSQAYYRLQFAKQELVLAAENLVLYNNFLEVTTALLESGETGSIPQLAARSRLGKAQLQKEHANEKYQIALALLNHWLPSDTLYDVDGPLLIPVQLVRDTSLQNNPHLQVLQARQELAEANVEVQKVQLLPQINSGLRLQNAFGTFPLFGYQVGVNVPLFQKSYRERIDAAKVGVMVQEAALEAERQQLERTLSDLRYRLEHQLHILEYLQEDLRPVVEEQRTVHLQAYREGTIGYLEYLDSLEQLMDVKQQYWDAVYQSNALQVELDFWLGNE